MVIPDLGFPWLPRPPWPMRWAASATGATAYQALLSTASLLATGRRVTVALDTGDLQLRIDRFDVPVAPTLLAAGRLGDLRLKISDIQWQGRVFERAEVVLRNVRVHPNPLPLLTAGPVDLTLQVRGTEAAELLAAVEPRLATRLGRDGLARLWWARRPAMGWMEVAPELHGSGLWLRPRALGWREYRLRLPAWMPARSVPLSGLPHGFQVSDVELGTDNLVVRGGLPHWRIELAKARLENLVAALRVTGLPLLNLRDSTRDA
ncbi:hypothetical protein [Mycolicibacterium fallax]|nr:hypothetical protein [Mycolicibacterium fallax]BBY97634.1 hypothetical protein MFAL_11010 [Mycolicibacterium fallax]